MKPQDQLQLAAIDQWNATFPVGTTVWYLSTTGQQLPCKTASEASIKGRTAMIFLEGRSRCVALDRVRLRTEVIAPNRARGGGVPK